MINNTYVTLYTAIFLLATNGLFSKLIPLDATSLTQLRSVFAGITLLVICKAIRRTLRLGSTKHYLGVYGIGIIMGLHWVTLYQAMQVSTVAIGMLSLFTFPMITVLIEPFFSKKSLRKLDIVSACLVFTGMLLMISDSLDKPDSPIMQGVFWGVISAILFSLRNIVQKYRFADIPSDKLMLHQVIAISIMLVAFIDFSAIQHTSNSTWLKLIILGIFTTAGAHTLLVLSLKRLPAKSVAMISCLQPLIATLLAWLFIDEIPTLSVIFGGTVILMVALYESATAERQKVAINDR